MGSCISKEKEDENLEPYDMEPYKKEKDTPAYINIQHADYVNITGDEFRVNHGKRGKYGKLNTLSLEGSERKDDVARDVSCYQEKPCKASSDGETEFSPLLSPFNASEKDCWKSENGKDIAIASGPDMDSLKDKKETDRHHTKGVFPATTLVLPQPRRQDLPAKVDEDGKSDELEYNEKPCLHVPPLPQQENIPQDPPIAADQTLGLESTSSPSLLDPSSLLESGSIYQTCLATPTESSEDEIHKVIKEIKSEIYKEITKQEKRNVDDDGNSDDDDDDDEDDDDDDDDNDDGGGGGDDGGGDDDEEEIGPQHCELPVAGASRKMLIEIGHKVDVETMHFSANWIGLAENLLGCNFQQIEAIRYHTKGDPSNGHFMHLVKEMETRNLKCGHIVQYFGQQDSLRLDVVDLIHQYHSTCRFCSGIYRRNFNDREELGTTMKSETQKKEGKRTAKGKLLSTDLLDSVSSKESNEKVNPNICVSELVDVRVTGESPYIKQKLLSPNEDMNEAVSSISLADENTAYSGTGFETSSDVSTIDEAARCSQPDFGDPTVIKETVQGKAVLYVGSDSEGRGLEHPNRGNLGQVEKGMEQQENEVFQQIVSESRGQMEEKGLENPGKCLEQPERGLKQPEHLDQSYQKMKNLKLDLYRKLTERGVPDVTIWIVEKLVDTARGNYMYVIQTVSKIQPPFRQYNGYDVVYHCPSPTTRGDHKLLTGISRCKTGCDYILTVQNLINGHLAKLFESHSNLVDVTVHIVNCPMCTGESKGREDLVIELQCPIVGYRPKGEPLFPKTLKCGNIDYETIITENMVYAACPPPAPNDVHNPLKIGSAVSASTVPVSGTLGPFFWDYKSNNSVSAVSCAHVFHNVADVAALVRANGSQSQPSGAKVHQPPIGVCGSREIGEMICAKITKGGLLHGKPKAGVDGAIVHITDPSCHPTDGCFCWDDDDKLQFCGFPDYPHYNGKVEKDISKWLHSQVYMYGKTSGWQKGGPLQHSSWARLTLFKPEFLQFQYVLQFQIKIMPFYDDERNAAERVVPFAKQGDSGAGVFMVENNELVLVGILCGVSVNGSGYVTPIGDFLECLSRGNVKEFMKFNVTDQPQNATSQSVPMAVHGYAACVDKIQETEISQRVDRVTDLATAKVNKQYGDTNALVKQSLATLTDKNGTMESNGKVDNNLDLDGCSVGDKNRDQNEEGETDLVNDKGPESMPDPSVIEEDEIFGEGSTSCHQSDAKGNGDLNPASNQNNDPGLNEDLENAAGQNASKMEPRETINNKEENRHVKSVNNQNSDIQGSLSAPDTGLDEYVDPDAAPIPQQTDHSGSQENKSSNPNGVNELVEDIKENVASSEMSEKTEDVKREYRPTTPEDVAIASIKQIAVVMSVPVNTETKKQGLDLLRQIPNDLYKFRRNQSMVDNQS